MADQEKPSFEIAFERYVARQNELEERDVNLLVSKEAYLQFRGDFDKRIWNLEALQPVFPSTKCSIVATVDDLYGGAHEYTFTECRGFENGQTVYETTTQKISFVRKEGDVVTPGLQSEQLIIALIDRHEKLNAVYPHPCNDACIFALKAALAAQEARVKERINRGVMGQLTK